MKFEYVTGGVELLANDRIVVQTLNHGARKELVRILIYKIIVGGKCRFWTRATAN